MLSEVPIPELIADNVMSREDMLSYIGSNFPGGIDTIARIKLVNNYLDMGELLAITEGGTHVHGFRRPVFELPSAIRDGYRDILICNNDGADKVYQYELQVEVLRSMGYEIDFDTIDLHSENEYWSRWENSFHEFIGSEAEGNISGIILGSRFNFHFLLACEQDRDFWQKRVPRNKIGQAQAYIDSRKDIIATERINLGRGESFAIDDLHLLESYFLADYLFYADETIDKSKYYQTTQHQQCYRAFNSQLDFNVLKLPQGNIVNIDWVPRSQTERFLRTATGNYDVQNIFYYGKCGYFGAERAVGDIVFPTQSRYRGQSVLLNNLFADTSASPTKTLCVDSPLVETRRLLSDELGVYGSDTVEMESYGVGVALDGQGIYATYYISDLPMSPHNLSVRLDQADTRLQTTSIIYDQIKEKYF